VKGFFCKNYHRGFAPDNSTPYLLRTKQPLSRSILAAFWRRSRRKQVCSASTRPERRHNVAKTPAVKKLVFEILKRHGEFLLLTEIFYTVLGFSTDNIATMRYKLFNYYFSIFSKTAEYEKEFLIGLYFIRYIKKVWLLLLTVNSKP
jgi:hypothetical protein